MGNAAYGIKADESLGPVIYAAVNWWNSPQGPTIAANAGGNRPSAETLEIKEVQVSLLERLLTGLRSLFVREEKLE